MTPEDETMRKLEQALAKAHRARQTLPLGPEWTQRVMREVRRGGIQEGPASARFGLETFIWQSAGLAVALALILTVSLMIWSPSPSSEDIGAVAEEFEPTPLFHE